MPDTGTPIGCGKRLKTLCSEKEVTWDSNRVSDALNWKNKKQQAGSCEERPEKEQTESWRESPKGQTKSHQESAEVSPNGLRPSERSATNELQIFHFPKYTVYPAQSVACRPFPAP
jgi:hypothetical protein